MAVWKSNRLYEVVTQIEDNTFVLPVMQRRLVWDENKMELLFDTLLKGNSFGGIMVLEEETNSTPLFAFRSFTKDGSPEKSVNHPTLNFKRFLVIDGQQRLQTFYIGLLGNFNGKVLYFDIFSDYENLEYDFKFESNFTNLPKLFNEKNKIKKCNWYSVNDLYNRLKATRDESKVAKEIIKNQNIVDEVEKDHITENVKLFYKNVFDKENIGLSIVYIDKTTDETANRQRVVELFRRLNDGGTRLSTYDLVASILKGFDWQMEEYLDQTLKDFKDIGLTQENLIKLIFLLRDNSSKEMLSIDASDATFAIQNKEKIKSALIGVDKFLEYSGLKNYFKNSNPSFVPIYFIAYYLFHKDLPNNKIEVFFDNYDTNNPEYKSIYKWINYSYLNGIFKSKGAGWIPYKTGVNRILGIMKLNKNKNFPVDDIFQLYFNYPLRFFLNIDSSNIYQFDYSFLFFLIYDKTQVIRNQDIDHIHPRSILETIGIAPDKINNIANFQLIDSGTNRGEKNAKELNNWISLLANKDYYLKRHLIPTNETLWVASKFDDFLTERADLLNKKIDKMLNI